MGRGGRGVERKNQTCIRERERESNKTKSVRQKQTDKMTRYVLDFGGDEMSLEDKFGIDISAWLP